MKQIWLSHDARLLIVVPRRFRELLLTTPLIRSVKRAFPSINSYSKAPFLTGRRHQDQSTGLHSMNGSLKTTVPVCRGL
jgi:hypothetical protein